MTKRELKDSAKTSNEKYEGLKTQRKQAMIKRKRMIATVLLAAGITAGVATKPAISAMANFYNNNITTENAIKTADTSEKYIEKLNKQDSTMEEKLNVFNEYVQRYSELKVKKGRTVKEDEELIEKAENIYNSEDLAIEARTDLLKQEIADSYGITNYEDIKSIQITCIWHWEGSSVPPRAEITVEMPNKIGILKNSDLDSKIAEEIKTIKTPLRYKKKNISELDSKGLFNEVNQIIKYYNEGLEYSRKYNIQINKKGVLKSVRDEERE